MAKPSTPQSQLDANRRYREKTAGLPRLPAVAVDAETARKLDALAEKFGSKKLALVAAIDALYQSERSAK